MKEDFLHYIWKNGYFNQQHLFTTEGESIDIQYVGMHNMDAGPDFFNARIKIGDFLWAGNVEIHLKAGDWYKHKHQFDKNYDNIILHVVYDDDEPVYRSSGEMMPTLILNERIEESIRQKYIDLLQSGHQQIPCERNIRNVPALVIQQWFDRLLVERLEDRNKFVKEQLELTRNNWEEVFYRMLARAFGFRVNNIPFQILSEQLPYTLVIKERKDLLSIESLLYGQAGFLDERNNDAYYKKLKKQFEILQAKYKLVKLQPGMWKFGKMRPANFPTIRIAQFAMLWHRNERLFHKLIGAQSIEELYKILDVEASDYWYLHYSFNTESKAGIKKIGKESIENLIINCIATFAFLYGKYHRQEGLMEKAISWLEALPAEKNKITEIWHGLGLTIRDAGCSQSILHLKKFYCDQKNCVNCAIGNHLLNKT